MQDEEVGVLKVTKMNIFFGLPDITFYQMDMIMKRLQWCIKEQYNLDNKLEFSDKNTFDAKEDWAYWLFCCNHLGKMAPRVKILSLEYEEA